MKRYDQIDLLKDRQFSFKYKADGLIDLCLGMALILIWLGHKFSNPLLFFTILLFFPMFMFIFKRKLVFPRMGRAQFTDIKKRNRILYVILYTVFIGAGLAIWTGVSYYQNNHAGYFLLLNGLLLVSGGLLIWGSLTQRHILYVMAMSLIFPLGSNYIPQQLWFGMPTNIIFNVAVITFISSMLLHKQPIINKQTARRPNLVIHSCFLVAGIGIITCVCLSISCPIFWVSIKQHVIAQPWISFSYLAAIILFCLGYAFTALRYYLYALLLSLNTALASILTSDTIVANAMLPITGVIILLSGSLVLYRFLVNNPVLQEQNDELTKE